MSRITTCPHCSTRLRVSEQITDKALICPHCLANLDNPQPGSQIRFDDINTDVKRDVSAGCIVLAVLIGLCVLGIATAYFQGNPGIPLLGFSCAALALLVSIVIIHLRTPARSSVAGACSTAFLVLGAIVGIFIFFAFTCASMWKPNWH